MDSQRGIVLRKCSENIYKYSVMKYHNAPALDFDDVLILPQHSYYKSRSDVVLNEHIPLHSTQQEQEFYGIPLIISNMATTGTFEIAKVASKYNVLTAIHKFYTYEDWQQNYRDLNPEYIVYSIGGGTNANEELKQFQAVNKNLFGSSLRYLMIDVANGYSDSFLKWIQTIDEQLRAQQQNVTIIAGNVVTENGVFWMMKSGASIAKVGIGSGAMCKTRVQTGIGMPQFSAVLGTSMTSALPIISDGGIKTPGDIAKAFVAGATFAMIGSLFAGFDESGGETVEIEGEYYKTHYGMSSRQAQKRHYDSVKGYRSSEGRSVLVPSKGPFEPFLKDILNNLRSTITYTGVSSLTQLHVCEYARVNRTHETFYEPLDIDDDM